MTLLAFLIGITLPAANGWLLLRCIEGRTPVLLRSERWALGFLTGLTGTMSLSFFLQVAAHVPFSRMGFLALQIPLLLLLALLARWTCGPAWLRPPTPALPPSPRPPRWALALLVLLGIWTVAKVGTESALLVSLPPYFDDTVKNWNFRGKVFYVTQSVSTGAPGRSENLLGQLSSYPPAVSLSKTWFASLAGEWNEGLINSVHLAWFAACVILFYTLLRRRMSCWWSFLGIYLLTSLPLFLIHGTQAYAEVFVAAHLLAVGSLLYSAAEARERVHHMAFLRLAAVMLALIPLTKNEGLVLYLPPLLAIVAVTLVLLRRQDFLLHRDMQNALLWFGLCLLVTTLPWLLYKWHLGLTFGNAHALSGTSFAWQPRALPAISIGLFFEGSWLLLFPLLFVLLALEWRKAFFSPLAVLTCFFLLVFGMQIFLFLFTSLSSEATYQTGFGRGVTQLLPFAVAVGTLLVHRLVAQNE